MTTKKITIIIIVVVVVGLIAWDIYVFKTPEHGDTISEVVLEWAKRNPLFPFGLGFLMGHLLWPQKVKEK